MLGTQKASPKDPMDSREAKSIPTTHAHATAPAYPPGSGISQMRSIGFPRSKPTPAESMPAESAVVKTRAKSPPPMVQRPSPKKKPKGRLFISAVLIAIMASIASVVWTEFFKHAAYGTLNGRVRTVSSPWTASLAEVHVTEGQKVKRGELLATLHNPELELKISSLESQILVAQSAIDSRIVDLEQRRREFAIDRLRAEIDYHQIVGQLHSERARASELLVAKESIEQLGDKGFVSRVEASQSSIASEGQQHRVAAFEETALRYKEGLSQLQSEIDLNEAIKADRSKLTALQAELADLKSFAAAGQIRAIVDGSVLKIHEWSGELVSVGTPIMDVLDAQSLEAVLLVKQHEANKFKIGQSLFLNTPPNEQSIEFKVARIDDQTQPAPPNISRYYRHSERLVGIVAVPVDETLRDTQAASPVWLGGEVRLPYKLNDFVPRLPFLPITSSN